MDVPLRLGEISEKHLQEVCRSAFELVPGLGLKSLTVPLDSDDPDYERRLRLVTDAAFQLARHRNVDFELKDVSKGLSREFILAMEKELSPLCDVIDDTAFDTTAHMEMIRRLLRMSLQRMDGTMSLYTTRRTLAQSSLSASETMIHWISRCTAS